MRYFGDDEVLEEIARGGEDRSLRIEDSHRGKLLVRWQGHDAVAALAFSPDGKVRATDCDA